MAWGARCWLRAVGGGQLQSALADCDQSIALDATQANANTFNSRGFVNFMMGRYAQSIRDYDSAIAGDPKVASSYYMRGLAKARSGDPSADADKAVGIELEPEAAKRYSNYGVTSETKPEIPH
jgi:tetratricopeptide (TPR) repeat protein